MLADTSRKAYDTLQRVGEKQLAVFKFIQEHGPVCNLDIADGLGWEINRVTGRSRELFEMNEIEVAYKDKSRTGRTAKFWQVTPIQRRLI